MSKKSGRFLLLGAIFGFIAGLFLAPKKGSELRKQAKEKFEEVKDNPKDVLQETFEEVKNKINNFMDENIKEDDVHITEEEIVISRIFGNEGEDK